jgi:pyridoxal phosphate enzyme (YggS family)
MISSNAIAQNIQALRKKIHDAAARSGRNPDDVLLLGVTKTVEPELMRVAFDCGIKDFGENRVQEYIRKADILNRGCSWHIIGRMQTNKVKYLDNRITLIHSLDRMELAQAFQERGNKHNIHYNVLVEVNVSGEDSKAGIEPEKLPQFVREVSKMGNIHIKGLMTIAPYKESPEDVRWVFRGLKKLSVDILRERMENISMEHLSMGMSNDFEVAVEEGATIIRVGSAIFGERVYSP